jgi:hypothetical protein
MADLARWTAHSAMSDPAEYAQALARLPGGVGAMSRIVQGVLVHSDWLPAYGLEEGGKAISRRTLPVAERLGDIFERDARPLDERRPPAKRSPATCRDFALMFCSFLRANDVAARLRCGFAAYLGGAWEDHWVCEYRAAPTEDWQLADPQIDDVLKTLLRVPFAPPHVPRGLFLTAGEAWLGCRAGKLDPARFGHGATKGLRFMQVNVVRDHYALNNRETSPWDDWRTAAGQRLAPGEAESLRLDAVAAAPEQPIVEMAPYWLA